MDNSTKQIHNAEVFRKLHHSKELLILPNIWDSLGALLLQEIGYKSVATASASMAFANGYLDGEKIPFADLLYQLRQITQVVSIPVSVDFESGYAQTEKQLTANIEKLIEIGVIGINIEDSDKNRHSLLKEKEQVARIKTIRKAAENKGVDFFINARTDIYIYRKDKSPKERLDETIQRGLAYKEAGADCFYPIVMKNIEDIEATVKALNMPVNILTLPGGQDLKTLEKIGVSRVSLGPSLLKYAVKAIMELSKKLQNKEGFEDIIQNPVTSDYLEELIKKSSLRYL